MLDTIITSLEYLAAQDEIILFANESKGRVRSSRQWFTVPKTMSLYLRFNVNRRLDLNRLPMRTLDLATVSVAPKYQRVGLFKHTLVFLEDLTRSAGYEALYVENIHNLHLYKYLLDRNYARMEEGNSLYLVM